MMSFVEYLKEYITASILETDVIPYPAENVKPFKRNQQKLFEEKRKNFMSLL